MARNVYFNNKVRSEQNLYEDIIIESLKIYGQDVYYIPRDIVSEDKIFGDDIPSRFNSSYKIEMYLENIEGFDGEGDLFTRFGVEIRDEATFVVSRRRWTQTVARMDNNVTSVRPLEGDLIYLPLTNKLFQINFEILDKSGSQGNCFSQCQKTNQSPRCAIITSTSRCAT